MNSDDDDLKTAVLNPSNPAISEALEPRAPAGKITQLDVQGHDTASVFVLADRAQTIGRNATNAIRLNTVGISRTHARIYSDSGGWMVQDLESRNGVRVNGVRIEQPTRVSDGDQIQFSQFVFRLDLQTTSERTREAGANSGGIRAILDGEETAGLDTDAIRAGILATVGVAAGQKMEGSPNAAWGQKLGGSTPAPMPDLIRALEPHADAIARTLIDKATEGAPGALRLVVDRLWPAHGQTPQAPTVCAPSATMLARAQQLVHEFERGELTSDDAESVLRSSLFGPKAD